MQPTFSNEDMLASLIPLAVFEVPADFTGGVLVYGKDFTWDVPTGGSMSGAFDTMVEYPIEILLAT